MHERPPALNVLNLFQVNPPRPAAAGQRAKYQMKALRTLIVEDEMIIAMLLEDALAGMGHAVCAVEATESGAVEAAARCRPDLMIVDAGLQSGTGMSAVARILKTGPVPHVFISGSEKMRHALGPDAVFLQKPFTEPELDRAVQRALGTARTA
ncbi:MAG: response regulator [Alphaproteobacteria bacterium]